jgi:peptide/nickel transport system permease protein
MVCLAVIAFYSLIAIAAPFFFGDWDQSHNYEMRNLPPSAEHLFGTDAFGRSVLVKTILGARVSMTVGLFSNIIAVPLGMLLGAFAGYYGRRTDDTIVWFYSTLASIPGLILLIALKFSFQDKVLFEGTPIAMDLDGIVGVILVLGITSWIGTCRVVRAETMKFKELDYVLAAQALGRKDIAILVRHILPNVLHIGIISFSLGFVSAISAEVILSFLNIGVMDMPSWGKMINEARMDMVVGRWWELTAAVSATFIIVLAWNIFGDRLRDALDPRLRE